MSRLQRRGPSARAPLFPPIEEELRRPDPDRYKNKLARLLASSAADTFLPADARARKLLLARTYEEGHFERHPEEYRS